MDKKSKAVLKSKLKMDDEVIVLAGREKGKRGRIMAIDRRRGRVVVQGINKLRRFQKPTQENPKGGILELERPMHISNVAYYDSKHKKGCRLGYKIASGQKLRLMRCKGDELLIKQGEMKA